VFLDEAGFLLQPYRQRTWAPKGCTPKQLSSAKHHRRVSVAGALALSPRQQRADWYFQLTMASFKTAEIVEFLRLLHHQLRRKIILVWDRLNAHRSAAAWYSHHHPDWFQFEWLPPYAPQLNPVESCWSHTKCHELSNHCAVDVQELEIVVRKHLRAKRRRQRLLLSFFRHANLELPYQL
jgi:transposase